MQIYCGMLGHLSNVLTSGDVGEAAKDSSAPLARLLRYDVRCRHRLHNYGLRLLVIHGLCNKHTPLEVAT